MYLVWFGWIDSLLYLLLLLGFRMCHVWLLFWNLLRIGGWSGIRATPPEDESCIQLECALTPSWQRVLLLLPKEDSCLLRGAHWAATPDCTEAALKCWLGCHFSRVEVGVWGSTAWGPTKEKHGSHSRVVPVEATGSPCQEEGIPHDPAEGLLCRKSIHWDNGRSRMPGGLSLCTCHPTKDLCWTPYSFQAAWWTPDLLVVLLPLRSHQVTCHHVVVHHQLLNGDLMLLLSYYELIIEVMSYYTRFSSFLNFKILPGTGRNSGKFLWKNYSIASESQPLIINRKKWHLAPSLPWHVSSYNIQGDQISRVRSSG